MAAPPVTTALVHSDDWRRFDYGPDHPLRMERLGLTWRLMEAYGLTRLPGAIVREPTPAAEADIARFHAREYLDVLKDADSGVEPSLGCAYGLGAGDNPIFPGLWQAARLVAAGSMLAADMVASGQAQRAFHFAGGLHHAMRERASGFCYVNDAVLAILTLRARGLRVAYIDIDAHHGDGVQAAFYRDPGVMTVSTHERGERLFPGTGFVAERGDGVQAAFYRDPGVVTASTPERGEGLLPGTGFVAQRGEGEGVGFSVNLPLEAYTDSAVYLAAFDAVVPPLVRAFKPDVIVAQL